MRISDGDRSENFANRLSLQSYDTDRFGTQLYAFRVALDTPLGIGPGQWFRSHYHHATHNLYIRVLVENGWLGALSFATPRGPPPRRATWNGGFERELSSDGSALEV